jgi:hypothetical protein
MSLRAGPGGGAHNKESPPQSKPGGPKHRKTELTLDGITALPVLTLRGGDGQPIFLRTVGIPAKLNAESEGKRNGIPG